MSRAYKIAVKESIKRIIKGKDNVGTQLEILDVLPKEQMTELLKQELEKQGFKIKGGKMVRKDKDVTITVDPSTGEVDVSTDMECETEVSGEKAGVGDEDYRARGEETKKKLKEELKKELQKKVDKQEEELQRKATEKLEGQLMDLRKELDGVINRVTKEALKEKAKSMGQIKELTEDDKGAMTIVLEV